MLSDSTLERDESSSCQTLHGVKGSEGEKNYIVIFSSHPLHHLSRNRDKRAELMKQAAKKPLLNRPRKERKICMQ